MKNSALSVMESNSISIIVVTELKQSLLLSTDSRDVEVNAFCLSYLR